MTQSGPHALERTSPKGEEFVGVCVKCGQEGLSMAEIYEDCPRWYELTNEEWEALIIGRNE